MSDDKVTIIVSDGKGYNGYGDSDSGDGLATALVIGFVIFLVIITI